MRRARGNEEGEKERFVPAAMGFGEVYEVTASGDIQIRSLATGRLMKISSAGWVVLRDPRTRAPVRINALLLRPPYAEAEAEAVVAPKKQQKSTSSVLLLLLKISVLSALLWTLVRPLTSHNLVDGALETLIRCLESARDSLKYQLRHPFVHRWADDMTEDPRSSESSHWVPVPYWVGGWDDAAWARNRS
jgi:hypothetical protein